MRIRDFSGADFEPASKLLGACHHATHGERSYWHGADELCACLAASDHGFVAEDESGAMLGVVLVESPNEADHNRDLRMHWQQQRTIILTVCRSLGINPREDKVTVGDAGPRVTSLFGAAASAVQLFCVADGVRHEQVEKELARTGIAWLCEHGMDVDDRSSTDEDTTSQILPSEDAHNRMAEEIVCAHASSKGVDFVPYNYHIEQNGEVVAGIAAWAFGSDVHIDTLAVDESQRRKGLGGRLLAHVEEQAKHNGCTTASVDTFSFQAPEYYPAHGYEVVFRYSLDDGTERIYFSKRL